MTPQKCSRTRRCVIPDPLCAVSHPTEGKVFGLRSLVRFDGARPDITAAPTLGEHNRSVLAGIGYSEAEILELEKSGAA